MRKVTRDINEDVRDRVRALANTEVFQRSSRERKKVEMRLAHMKRILKLDRLRLRGLSGASYEVLLTALAQNLRPRSFSSLDGCSIHPGRPPCKAPPSKVKPSSNTTSAPPISTTRMMRSVISLSSLAIRSATSLADTVNAARDDTVTKVPSDIASTEQIPQQRFLRQREY
jgi:hypothetical protein